MPTSDHADPGARDELLNDLLLERYEPVAIVGVGLRFPGDNDSPGGFAEFLRSGGSGTGPIPADRWDVAGLAATEAGEKGAVGTSGGGFLSGIDQFDPRFFAISPKEAQYIDPQHRLVLETTWEALEHANIDPASLRHGSGGVYVGVSCVDYILEVDALGYEELDAYIGTGTAHSAIPGRVSYFLGLRGPSMAVDTACSSSLVSLHLAVEGLRRRECEIALCGGVNAIHHPRNHIVFSQANMLAPDGECKTFDAAADGYSRSEGCGMLVLKRLSDAKRDGDRILALVRGSAVRQDGESGGLTVPNGSAQEAVMRAALDAAMLAPEEIQYVEAHGTGTPLGDPIEMGAIRAVFAASHSMREPILVGSLKTNVGHMEAAAGVGGIVKTVLQLRDGQIYPHLNLAHPSEHIPWASAPVAVPTEARAWPAGTRRALVNSFGFAGTIASVVLEQAPGWGEVSPAPPSGDAEPHLFTLSAITPRSLRLQAARYREFLDARPELSLADLCRTAHLGRAHLGTRLASVVHNRDELTELLAAEPRPAGPAAARVAFAFTGQGAQRPGMGAPLYDRYPVFRRHVDECDRLFAGHLGRSVRDLMLGRTDDPDEIHQTRFTQPALFTLEYSLAQLWLSWGVRPDVLIGHSIGEVTAAALGGVLTLPDAVRLVAARAELMQAVSAPGGMVAVAAPMEQVADLVCSHDDLAFAAINAPNRCVVSGGRESLAAVVEAIEARGIGTRRLPVSHAFHSPLMAEIYPRFRAALDGIEWAEPQVPVVSNVTGRLADPGQMSDADYWVRHVGEPVRFADGVAAIGERGSHTFIEIGPGSTLLTLGRESLGAGEHRWLPSLHPGDEHGDVLLRALAAHYQAGASIDWAGFHEGESGRPVDLPTYAFDRKRYWLPLDGRRHARGGAADAAAVTHPLLGPEVTTTEQRARGEREFRTTLSPDRPRYLADHVVLGQVVFPAAGYVEVLLALQDEVWGETGRLIRDLDIHEPLLLPADQEVELRARLRPEDGGAAVEVVSRAPETGVERRHVTAFIAADAPAEPLTVLTRRLTADAAAPATVVTEGAEIYADYADLGLEYGPEFRRIERIERHGDVAVSVLRGHRTAAVEMLAPFVLDCVIQTLAAVAETEHTYLPVRFGAFRFLRKPKGERLRGLVRITGADPERDEISAELLLLDEGRPVFQVSGLAFRRVVNTAGAGRRLFHEPSWTKRSLVRQQSRVPERVVAVHPAAAEVAHLTERVERAGIELVVAESAAEAGRLLADRPGDVCWFWQAGDGPVDAGSLREECERNYRDLLDLARRLDGVPFGDDRRLWLVTTGAQRLPGDRPADSRLAPATLWGFGHSWWSEHPTYRVTLVDLPAGRPDEAAESLVTEWCGAEADEFQVAYRDGARHVRRIRAVQPGVATDDVELVIQRPGEFDGVRPVPVRAVAPIDDQVQVRVHAAGLNFKDVLNALGLLRQHAEDTGTPYQELPLGFEAAGTVVASGPRADFAPGDEVMVSALGCMKRLVTVPSTAVVRKPAGIGFAEAAALPTAYVTAYHALHELAGIRAGDRVLIHAAAGGVGQAAVRLAQLAGAEVYATGSPRKQELLRRQGVAHVFNSRTLDFADEILRVTDGAGVDIVLNSLNKDFIPAGLRALGHGGRFVELGKIGIWSTAAVRDARPDVAYHFFDLSELPADELAATNQRILGRVADLIEQGALTPIPTTEYALSETAEAFGVLSRGGNVGKLVLRFGDERPRPRPVELRPDRTYLVTGGLGALGLLAGERLVAGGARHLALLSRRAVDDERRAELAARFGPDVRLEVLRGDVADPVDMARVTAALRAAPHPLGGVVHAAGVLADTPIATMDWAQVEAVLRPKVYGGWLLHRLAEDLGGVDLFVTYSSVSAPLGPVAQGNYAAANSFLDGLAHWRAGQGLPALSIDWGPWAAVGMAAGMDDRSRRRIEQQGLRFLSPVDGGRALTRLLADPRPQVMVGEFDWDRYVASRPAGNALYREVAREAARRAVRVDLDELRAQPAAVRLASVGELLRAKLAAVLHFDGADDVPAGAKFAELGLDSLMAVELKNALESVFGVPLPTSMVFDHPTVDAAARFIDQQLAPPERAGAATPEREVDVAQLSDAEAIAELDALRGS
ncbi:myxalamid-type polyketide synthase MxaB [Micromonospora pattaloongensis]|uniref:Myxalamid-type polyketide synthase MxaB n=1 Tax=Micromonospora pattaloongensis TaxID=405436 RepID=A0A1H3PB38_9ACTN|nr:type I polyketide synthase [Micromonospora pattaloongensis]SDY98278.1 myxalamid-type polyketide synthase MxaB [Micromonospora pattaloongensis]